MSNTDGKLYHSITSEWSTRTPADLGSCEERPGWASPSCRNQLLSRSWSLYSMFSEQSSPLAKQLGKKKIIFLKESDSFKAAEGRRRKQGFLLTFAERCQQQNILQGTSKQSRVSCLLHIQNPFILGETERIWLFLQLSESTKLCSTNPRLTLISSSFWMGSNVSEEKEEQFLPSPCGYIAISLTWTELFPLLSFYLAQQCFA